MTQFNYYFKTNKEFSEEKLFVHLKKSKYKLEPLFEQYQQDLNKKINNFGYSFSGKEKILEQHGWTLITNNKEIFMIFNYVGEGFELIIDVNSKQKSKEICDYLKQMKTILDYKEGKYVDDDIIRMVKKKVTKLSPNGKALKDKNLKKVFIKIIKSDKLRELVKKLADTYKDLPIPLEQINKLKFNEKIISELITNNLLVNKSYKVACKKCNKSSDFTFKKKKDALDSLNKADYICAGCQTKETIIREYYSLSKGVLKTVTQGLWLEKLCEIQVSDISQNYWAGYYVDTNELDGLTVYLGGIILVECKDTSFGQNDLYIALAKANEIRAKCVLIVTTNIVHYNVKKLIEKYQKESKNRKFYLICKTKSNDIKKELKKFLIKQDTKEISKLVSNRGLGEGLDFRRVVREKILDL